MELNCVDSWHRSCEHRNPVCSKTRILMQRRETHRLATNSLLCFYAPHISASISWWQTPKISRNPLYFALSRSVYPESIHQKSCSLSCLALSLWKKSRSIYRSNVSRCGLRDFGFCLSVIGYLRSNAPVLRINHQQDPTIQSLGASTRCLGCPLPSSSVVLYIPMSTSQSLVAQQPISDFRVSHISLSHQRPFPTISQTP